MHSLIAPIATMATLIGGVLFLRKGDKDDTPRWKEWCRRTSGGTTGLVKPRK